jgi:hypothetical protein
MIGWLPRLGTSYTSQPFPRSRSSGLQNAEVTLILDVTVRVPRPVEVDDAGIQAMCRIEFAEYYAMQPLIGPYGTEFRAAEQAHFPLGHLDPRHAAANPHDVLPREPVMVGEPSRLAGPPERTLPAVSEGGEPWRDAHVRGPDTASTSKYYCQLAEVIEQSRKPQPAQTVWTSGSANGSTEREKPT